MILFWRNALFHLGFPMILWIFVFQMKFKNMILRFTNFESFLTNLNFWRPQNRCFWSSHWKTLNWTKWCSFHIEINFWQGPKWDPFWSQNDIKIIFLNFIWKTKIHKFIGNSQWNKAFLQNKIIIYIIQILNIIEDSFKKLHMKSLRFASTKRIWKAIFIKETRRNVLRLCENFGLLRWKSTYKMYFLGRNARKYTLYVDFYAFCWSKTQTFHL